MKDLSDFMDDHSEEKKTSYSVTEMTEDLWLNFAMYTIENRAIPNMIDGLKPVQRFVLYSSIQNSRNSFTKVAEIGSATAKLGYHHGEGSACGALQNMAAPYQNNVALIEPRGSFGTRLVQVAAAPRYTFSKLSQNFFKYFVDVDIAPKHDDPEHIPPKHYVPVIPFVLINGVKGIATGFATSILPRDPVSVAKACKEYIEQGKIKTRPKTKFPEFSGKTWFDKTEHRFYQEGTFIRKSSILLEITEVPYGFDRVGYMEVLDDLVEKGKIVDYEDLCGKNGFNFEVKLKREFKDWKDEDIIREFKLRKATKENITVIDWNGKLREYEDELDLIRDFCDYRLEFLQKRIDKNVNNLTNDIRWLEIKMAFIQAVLDDKIIFKNKKKAEVAKDIVVEIAATEEEADRLLRLNIVSLTSDMIAELVKEITESKKQLVYWKKTTTKEQFIDDLGEL